MTEEYPVLHSMGIINLQQMLSYSVYMTRKDMDVLRIKYKRPKGSLLPVSRTYKFGRSQRFETIESGSRKAELVYDISPLLNKATTELDTIIKRQTSNEVDKRQILDLLDRMQNEVNTDFEVLRQMIDKHEK